MEQHKLKVLKQATTLTAFAESVGISNYYLSRLVHGKRAAHQPTAELLAIKANQITKSKIYTAEDFQQEKP